MTKPANGAIVVFGEALVDEFPGQKVIGGAPFNVARNLASFACQTLLISRVGVDHEGELIRADMQRCGLEQGGIQSDAKHASGRVIVTQEDPLDKSSHRFEIVPFQAYDYIQVDAAREAISSFCQHRQADLLYFGSLAQRGATSRETLQTLLKESAAIKYLDLNLRDGQVLDTTIDISLRMADIVKLNEEELLYLLTLYVPASAETGAPALDLNADRLSWKPAIDILMQQFDLRALIITLGARGYAYFDAEGHFFSASQHQASTEIVDTVGGGDAFSSVFLAGLYHGWPLAASLRRAHEFATAVCGIRGAVSPDAEFYQKWVQRWAEEE